MILENMTMKEFEEHLEKTKTILFPFGTVEEHGVHLAPDLVKGLSPEEYPDFPRPYVVKNKLKYWQGGVWGNPAAASREKGKKAVNLIVDKIVEIIDQAP